MLLGHLSFFNCMWNSHYTYITKVASFNTETSSSSSSLAWPNFTNNFLIFSRPITALPPPRPPPPCPVTSRPARCRPPPPPGRGRNPGRAQRAAAAYWLLCHRLELTKSSKYINIKPQGRLRKDDLQISLIPDTIKIALTISS